jgi:serine/threonine protein kinase
MESKSIDGIFWDAVQLGSAAEREAYLDRACAGDRQLRSRVEQLLLARQQAESFLESPAPNLLATVDVPPVTEQPGSVIGPYKLLEQIGEGGFGVVFLAEQQEPLRRKVALKVLKPGMDTRQVIARFEAERQALALMDHPNIAQVHDGGSTARGRPYFVMELVKGVPLTDYCDQNSLPIRERLALFIAVCQAVQHAHHKGIIHRDIKPSNVLVTRHDATPVVKVIDFGIAKATGQQLTEKTLFTHFAQLMGTPLYMSPEQAGLSDLDVDTRSDIYSLGVLLYELLTGTTPFDKERFKEAGYDEMRRIIREEEPPRPSTRLSTLGQAASTASARRQTDPRRLSQALRGELDWIVMKCLEKDRSRRYESANGLAQDIERYLRDEPVQACPPSGWYRFSKLARRHKRALATATCVVGILVLASWVSTVLIAQAYQEERRQRENAEESERTADEQRRNAEATARQLLENLLAHYEDMDKAYLKVVERDWPRDPRARHEFEQLLREALRSYEDFARRNANVPDTQAHVARASYRIGRILRKMGQNQQALARCDQAIRILEGLINVAPKDHRYRLHLAFSHSERAWVVSALGDLANAEKEFRTALHLCDNLARKVPDAEYQYGLAMAHYNLADVLRRAQRLPEAEAEVWPGPHRIAKAGGQVPNQGRLPARGGSGPRPFGFCPWGWQPLVPGCRGIHKGTGSAAGTGGPGQGLRHAGSAGRTGGFAQQPGQPVSKGTLPPGRRALSPSPGPVRAARGRVPRSAKLPVRSGGRSDGPGNGSLARRPARRGGEVLSPRPGRAGQAGAPASRCA